MCYKRSIRKLNISPSVEAGILRLYSPLIDPSHPRLPDRITRTEGRKIRRDVFLKENPFYEELCYADRNNTKLSSVKARVDR